MTHATTSDDNNQSAIGEHLDEIGDEFGCHRTPAESNELFGLRLIDYLEDMIGELRACQDSVRELMT